MMRKGDHTAAGRCARALLCLFRRHADHRLSGAELQQRREEVNRELSELGNEAFNEALQTLYRLAEAEARRNAGELARAMHQRRPF
jgi:hypothetical protein